MFLRLRSKITYANVMATIAVFLALGGGALAATSFVGSDGTIKGCVSSSGNLKVLKPGKKCGKGTTKIAWNQKGPAGQAGAACLSSDPKCKGPKGDACPSSDSNCRGAAGAPGSPAASTLTGRTGNFFIDAFAYPSGATPGTGFDAEGDASTLSPAQPIVGRDLFVKEDHLSTNPLNPRTYSLRVNGVDSPLSCTTTAGSTNPSGSLACSDATDAVTIAPGSTLSIHCTMPPNSGGGAEPPIPIRFGWRATTP
jgi:hypothetical protein